MREVFILVKEGQLPFSVPVSVLCVDLLFY